LEAIKKARDQRIADEERMRKADETKRKDGLYFTVYFFICII
jgi:hypothetical protein